jgi:hypothetical protein
MTIPLKPNHARYRGASLLSLRIGRILPAKIVIQEHHVELAALYSLQFTYAS